MLVPPAVVIIGFLMLYQGSLIFPFAFYRWGSYGIDLVTVKLML